MFLVNKNPNDILVKNGDEVYVLAKHHRKCKLLVMFQQYFILLMCPWSCYRTEEQAKQLNTYVGMSQAPNYP
jgi:hypothetical protein